MTSRVTLEVFSGRPNPTWLLSEQEEQQLAERLDALSEPTDKRPSGSYGGLGYRGFSITRDVLHPQGPLSLLIHEGVVDHQFGGSNMVADSGLESWLAEIGRSHVPDVVQEHVRASIASGKGWYVALVIWPNADYHWYRQDKVGCWSHKPGSTVVRNVDNAGQQITDPRTCNRGPYTIFCIYMVTNRGVHIK